MIFDEKYQQDKLRAEKEDLVDVLLWYRDEYHHSDFGHSDMIAKVKVATTAEELERIEKVIDGWLCD